MKIISETFWVQKRGNSLEEYEDAAYPTGMNAYDQTCARFAVADGATESVFARRWAEQLVHAVGSGELSPRSIIGGLTILRDRWQEWLSGRSLPWYSEEKARQGTFAALLALEFTADEAEDLSEGAWYAAAVGDSCLVHCREKEVLSCFPLGVAEAFDSRPHLLGSVNVSEQELNDVYASGKWKSGDTFYLMTDALACWFIKHAAPAESPADVDRIATLGSEHSQFGIWVESLRDKGILKNDDCTLMRLQIR